MSSYKNFKADLCIKKKRKQKYEDLAKLTSGRIEQVKDPLALKVHGIRNAFAHKSIFPLVLFTSYKIARYVDQILNSLG